MTACGGSAEEGDHGYLTEEETTTAFTVEIVILLHLSQSMAIIKISSEFFYANSSPAVSL